MFDGGFEGTEPHRVGGGSFDSRLESHREIQSDSQRELHRTFRSSPEEDLREMAEMRLKSLIGKGKIKPDTTYVGITLDAEGNPNLGHAQEQKLLDGRPDFMASQRIISALKTTASAKTKGETPAYFMARVGTDSVTLYSEQSIQTQIELLNEKH